MSNAAARAGGLSSLGKLTDLKQRVRDVRQGPDGLIYILTDEENGALIRIEPRP